MSSIVYKYINQFNLMEISTEKTSKINCTAVTD